MKKYNLHNLTIKEIELYVKAYKQYLKDHNKNVDEYVNCSIGGIIDFINNDAPDYYTEAVRMHLLNF